MPGVMPRNGSGSSTTNPHLLPLIPHPSSLSPPMPTKTERILLSLLRSGLWMKEPDDTELFPLTGEEWQEVYRLAKEQTVGGPVFQGICLLKDEMMPPLDLLQRWTVHVDHIEQANKRMNETQRELLSRLTSNGLKPIVLKGQGVAQFYVHPLQRTCGDIDLYFPKRGDYQLTYTLTKEWGLKPQKMADGAFSFQYKGEEVECHQRLLDIYNPFRQKSIREMIAHEGFDDTVPSPILNLLLLNTHILKHLMGHGIGLRQLSDMACAYHTLKGQYDEHLYRHYCQQLHIAPWTAQLECILSQLLGLPATDLPLDALPQNAKTGPPPVFCDQSQNLPRLTPAPSTPSTLSPYIYNKVLRGGNFGHYATTRAPSGDCTLKRRWRTATTLLREWRHLHHLAPSESLWYITTLIT